MVTIAEPRPVLVAVATDGSASAVRFGVEEARRRRTTMRLVHVVDLVPWRGADLRGAAERHAHHGEEVLAQAVAHARSLAGERVAVSSELFHGQVVPGLLEVALDASVLVLARRPPLTAPEQAQAVCLKVAARTRVPVVCVPHDWSGARPGASAGVTVGVDHAATCERALRESLTSAAARGTGLRVVCGWWMARDEGDGPVAGVDPRSVRQELEQVLAAIVADDADLTSVPVVIDVVHARPVDLLVDASHSADLLVVGRHDPLVPRGSRIGPVARAAMTRASCPVLLPTGANHPWLTSAHRSEELPAGARA